MPEWAFEAYEDLKGAERTITEDKKNAFQAALYGINKRITNLTDLKISPGNVDGSLLSDEEFAERKRSLLIEKDKLLNQIQAENGDNESWELAKESFVFGLRAKERFDNDDPEEQKTIVKTVWSNLILLDQNLQFQPRYIFLKYKNAKRSTEVKTRL